MRSLNSVSLLSALFLVISSSSFSLLSSFLPQDSVQTPGNVLVTVSGWREKERELALNLSRKPIIPSTSPFLTLSSLCSLASSFAAGTCARKPPQGKSWISLNILCFMKRIVTSGLSVGLLGSEEKGLLRQAPRDRLSHPGTTAHGHTACQGLLFTVSVSGASAAAYKFFNPIRELHCPVSVIIILSLPDTRYLSILANPFQDRPPLKLPDLPYLSRLSRDPTLQIFCKSLTFSHSLQDP